MILISENDNGTFKLLKVDGRYIYNFCNLFNTKEKLDYLYSFEKNISFNIKNQLFHCVSFLELIEQDINKNNYTEPFYLKTRSTNNEYISNSNEVQIRVKKYQTFNRSYTLNELINLMHDVHDNDELDVAYFYNGKWSYLNVLKSKDLNNENFFKYFLTREESLFISEIIQINIDNFFKNKDKINSFNNILDYLENVNKLEFCYNLFKEKKVDNFNHIDFFNQLESRTLKKRLNKELKEEVELSINKQKRKI